MGTSDQQIKLENRVCLHAKENPNLQTKSYLNVLGKYNLNLCPACSVDPIFSGIVTECVEAIR